jgi:hypothetical protein
MDLFARGCELPHYWSGFFETSQLTGTILISSFFFLPVSTVVEFVKFFLLRIR